MNELLPRPWDSAAYGLVCVVSLVMATFILVFISSHCEWVYETTGIPGTCGLGIGWVLFCLGFFAVAAYSGRQLYGTWKERQGE